MGKYMKVCKKNILILAAAFLCGAIYSQNNAVQENGAEAVEEIFLPDVSTVISGGAPKVGKSAISDFTDVLPSADKQVDYVIPELPETSESGTLNSDSVLQVAPEKTIYVEGVAGGGYPGYITGNFKIYRQTGISPFKVEFGHDSANGYAGKSLTSAYSDRETYIAAEKVFKTKRTQLNLGGKFESDNDGLQNKFENISGITKETLSANFDWKMDFENGVGFGFSSDGNWYKRYATVTGTPVTKIEDYAKNIGFLDFLPKGSFWWKNNGFELKFNASYNLAYDLKNALFGYKATSRGDFSVDFSWQDKSETAKIYANAGIVVGNHIGGNDFVVPFCAGTDFSFKNALSSRKITLGFEGGLDSYLLEVSSLENKFKFAVVAAMPEETSDFYGKATMLFPIKDRFTLSAFSEFRKTAFDNGLIEPDYDVKVSVSDIFGQYLFVQDEKTQFNTDINFAVRVGIANISANWKSYWIDVPADEASQFVNAAISLQTENSAFGFDGSFGLSLNPDDDNVPEVDLSVFWRLTPAVRLAVTVDDVVKLISGEEREYAGEYISRSGTVALLVKFFF